MGIEDYQSYLYWLVVAFRVSTLNTIALQVKLGIDGWLLLRPRAPLSVGDLSQFLDVSGDRILSRRYLGYETEKIGKIVPEQVYKEDILKLNGWMMSGVIREDDTASITGAIIGGPPNEPGVLRANRFCNHFFDPVNIRSFDNADPSPSRGFSGFCFGQRVKDAPQWALGSDSPFAASPQDLANRLNHFTIRDAREYQWRALTLKTADFTDAQHPDIASGEDNRKAYWASTFRTVGHVIHLLQDMAQPQHTRNVGHAPLHTTSGYEGYINARVLGESVIIFQAASVQAAVTDMPPLNFGGYPIPRFKRFSDYWSSRLGGAGMDAGLADYSNRGFLTLGSDLSDSPVYTRPPRDENAYTKIATPIVGDYTISHLTIAVPDDLVGNSAPIKMTTESVLSNLNLADSLPPLEDRYIAQRAVYEDQASLLIPRAVGYSAGLIDYFFRGRLEITPPDDGLISLVDHADFAGVDAPSTNAGQGFNGFKTIKVNVRNTTPDIAAPNGVAKQNMVGGKLVAVLKFHRNLSYSDDLAKEPTNGSNVEINRSDIEEIVVSNRVKDENGNAVPSMTLNTTSPAKLLYFEFDKQLPINATDVYLQVVYRGALGDEEDAVAVETIHLSEPTHLSYMNSSDYTSINNAVYTLAEVNGDGIPAGGTETGQQLRDHVQPRSCIDSTTNLLREACVPSFDNNFVLKTTDTASTNTTRIKLKLPKSKTYHRLAMLTPIDKPAKFDFVNNDCVPTLTYDQQGRTVQVWYDPLGRAHSTVTNYPDPVRGVYGVITACVNQGDAQAANGSAKRIDKMSPLTGDNAKPLPLADFYFGAP